MKKSKNQPLPKPRNKLHKILELKITSNASGKHLSEKLKKSLTRTPVKIDEDFDPRFF